MAAGGNEPPRKGGLSRARSGVAAVALLPGARLVRANEVGLIGLGISYQMHDSSACLVRDGKVVAAIAEERLSRAKHDSRFPANAIRSCLEIAGVSAVHLEYVAFGWSKPSRAYLHDLKSLVTRRYPASGRALLNSTRQFVSMTRREGGWREFYSAFGATPARVYRVDHHLSHALSAYACAGFGDSTVVVMDGRGAWEATSIWMARDGRLEPVEIIPFPQSLGLFYAEMTYYLGFEKYSDEWKVMGLAPYGEPGIDLSGLVDLAVEPYHVNARALLGHDSEDVTAVERLLGPRRAPEGELDDRHRAIAFAVQDACEQAMMNVVRYAIRRTGCRTLCLAGGVALNSKANGAILRSGLVDDLFIQPAAADDGASLGAAMYPYLLERSLPSTPMRDAYFGPSYDADVEAALRTYKLRHTPVDAPAKVAAELIAQGRVVGWMQGRMEFGPAGARRAIDPRGSTRRGDERACKRGGEVPGGMASVRAIVPGGGRHRLDGGGARLAVHDLDLRCAPRTSARSRGRDACGRKPPAADGRA